MKIAIVTPTFPPYAGGIGNVAAFNAKELVKLGHQVTVFTPFYKQVKEEFSDLNIKRIPPLFKYGNAAFVPALSWMLEGFDIIHIHYPFFGGAEVVWLHKRKFKKQAAKIVLHYHMDVVGQGMTKLFFKLHRMFILPRIVKMANKVIFTSMDYGNSSYLAQMAKKNPNKFIEVPNGVDSNNFVPEAKDEKFLAKHEINLDEKIILFVGGLDKAHYFKGIEYLIEAVSRLRDAEYKWRLLIVGEGDLKEYYISLINQFRLESKTIFAGYVPNEDLPKYYNLADVAVLPSVDKSEAFGLALVEAMSCGKPVIASNLPGVRSVVTEKLNGLLVEPKNSDDLAAKINFFLSNPGEAYEFGKAGRNKVKLKYDWSIIGHKLDGIYKGL
jgi:glycosyltransferase involved in cell wall biosynthesis